MESQHRLAEAARSGDTADRAWCSPGAAAAALLIFVLAGTGLLHRALFGDEVLSAATQLARTGPFPAALAERVPEDIDCLSDSNLQFVPWLRFAADALAADHRLPLWKDTAGTGAPFVGNGQSAVFFPTNLLAILAGAPPRALALQALAKLAGGAFCAWMLARHLRRSFLAAVACGLAFGFGGFQMGWFLHPHTCVSLLLPLLVLAADRLVLRPTAGRFALLAAVAGLQHLGGHPETTFHAQVAVALLGVARLVSLRATMTRGDCWRRAGWLFGGLLAGLGLGAVQVLPLLEYMRHSESLAHRGTSAPLRALTDPLAAAGFGVALVVALLALRRLATTPERLLSPALLVFIATCGGLLLGLKAGLSQAFVLAVTPDWFGTSRHYAGTAARIEWTGPYVGAALPLAVLGLLKGAARGPVRAAGVALAIGLLAGYGAPLVSDAIQALPVFHLAVNTRLQVLALLALAVLAAFGLDALGDSMRDARDRRRVVCALGAPLLATFAALVAAVPLGLISGSDLPSRPIESAITRAGLLPLATVAPLLPPAPTQAPTPTPDADSPSRSGPPARWFCGFVVSPVKPSRVSVLYGPATEVARAEWAAAPEPARDTWIFRAAVPEARLLPERAVVRVLVTDVDGGLLVSGGLVSPDDPGRAFPFPAQPAPGRTGWHLALLLLACGLMSVAVTTTAARTALRCALLLVIAASLWTFAHDMVPLLPRDLFYPPSPVLDALAAAQPDGRAVSLNSTVVGAEIPTSYGIADVRSYDALGPEHATALADAALARKDRGTASLAARTPDLVLLGVMAVSRVLCTGKPPEPLRELVVPGAEALPRHVRVMENPFALPRARLVGGAVVQPNDDRALALLRDADFACERIVVLAEGHDTPAPAGDFGSARIVRSRPEQVRVEIAPLAPGWLVLSDTFFPGWVALVDGRPRAIARANVGLRAVAVTPGDRVVEFRYEPASFRAGAVISLGTAALLGVAWLAARLRRAGAHERVARTGAA